MHVLMVLTGQPIEGAVEDNKRSLDLEVTALLPSVHLQWTSGSLIVEDFGVWLPSPDCELLQLAGWVALSGCCSRALGRKRLGLSPALPVTATST